MPILHALLTLLGLAALLTTLPLVLELTILSLAARLPASRTRIPALTPLKLAVLIPAHNEQQLIAACVASLRTSGGPALPIFVIAHNCRDATAELATAAGAQVLALNDQIGGKGNALFFGFTQALAAGAGAILVIDADSTVSPNLIPRVTRAFLTGSRALQCRYTVANTTSNPRTRLLGLAFLGINVLRPLGRSRLGLSCGIFGNGFALSADTLSRVPYVANSVVEDLEYHLHLIRAGIRVDFLNASTVLGEMPETSAGASSQRARWEGGRILMRRQWTRPLLKEVLSGRLRMLEPLLDLLALPLATNALILLASMLLPLTWLRLYALFGLFSLVLYILVAASLGPEPAQTLKALLSVPAYLVWKLAMIPKTRLAARRDAAWIRTQRNHSPDPVPSRESSPKQP